MNKEYAMGRAFELERPLAEYKPGEQVHFIYHAPLVVDRTEWFTIGKKYVYKLTDGKGTDIYTTAEYLIPEQDMKRAIERGEI